ncbi:hypothetical protein POM88_044827 [Heracleum sosnowskyi]|uniref:Uncharacterized protein n=1 Tax=Heracleum sosnowskyi TaxID=360622 RepID=A0AAD8H594_9APIA|nr:hypothetical protein POM88_044827 [Heracleum sosnowskyi]
MVSQQRSSQGSLCLDIDKLNMGAKRAKKNGIQKERGEKFKNALGVISEEKTQKEAELILECAKNLGLEMPIGVQKTGEVLVDKLSKGLLGIRGKSVGRFIRDTIRERSINIICLQETLCDSWNDKIMSSIWDMDSHGWFIQNSRGHSGGLMVSWDKELFKGVGFAHDEG